MAGSTNVFISYAPEDDAMCAELGRHLARLQMDGKVRTYRMRRVAAGEYRKEDLETDVEEAGVVLLLVSADYLAPGYVQEVEGTTALARSSIADARVIPVILHAVDQLPAVFAGLSPLPANGTPVSRWPNRQEAWAEVVRGIRQAITTAGPFI